MNALIKVQPDHLSRQAVVYIRQSTAKQVQYNQESTRRQYQLAEQAREMGWPQPLVRIIDDDLGMSGASSEHRLGFQKLVAAIGLGQVGIILVTEISRVSRLNSDWHRVIELCAVFETLIADEDGCYDPRDPNDRLLLGLKGTLFAAELHILRARMRGNLLNKARRGELVLRLPVGYRRLPDETVVLDPDEQVQAAICTVFEQFAALRSARAVQRYFHEHHLSLPRLIQTGLDSGQIRWVTPAYQMIQQILSSPVYAGVFVFGRRKMQVVPGNPPRTETHRLPISEWDIAIPEVYPTYISYDRYQLNRQILADNRYNFKLKSQGAPREGRGLLQGLLICGKCGRRMTPSYGSEYLGYVCRREQVTYATAQCQAFPMVYLDQALADVFLEAIQPASLEATLSALAGLERERQALDRQWQLRLERVRYQARLAQRQYDAVDPDNRLVARELEKRWNDALVECEQLEQEYALACRTDLAPLAEDERQAVRQLAQDLPALWNASTTTSQDRKRLLRLVIREITLLPLPEKRNAEFVVYWLGGAITTHRVTCPPMGWHCRTPAELVQRIQDLAQHYPDHVIADQLNAEGVRTRTGKEWTHERVRSLRKQYNISTACPIDPSQLTPRGDGLVPVKTAAQMLNISDSLVNIWSKQGVLIADQRTFGSYLWVRVTESDIERLNGSVDCSDLPTVADLMSRLQLTREQVWALVRSGNYLAYRSQLGRNWEWRLKSLVEPDCAPVIQGVLCDEKGTSHYE